MVWEKKNKTKQNEQSGTDSLTASIFRSQLVYHFYPKQKHRADVATKGALLGVLLGRAGDGGDDVFLDVFDVKLLECYVRKSAILD